VSPDAWTEGTATWVNYDGVNPWTQSGVGGPTGGALAGTGNTLGTEVYATIDIPTNGTVSPVDLDITPLVQGWLDGSLPNNGLAFNVAAGFDAANYWMTLPNHEVSGDDAPLLEFFYIESEWGHVHEGLPEEDTTVLFVPGGGLGNQVLDWWPEYEAQGAIGADNRQGRVMLQWDLSSITSRAQVASAFVRMQGSYSTGGNPDGTAEVRAIVTGNTWTEEEASWLYNVTSTSSAWPQGGTGGTSGSAPALPNTGHTLSSTAYGTLDLLNGGSTFNQDVDVTALVQEWISGTRDNNGLAFGISPGLSDSYWLKVPSKEDNPDEAPYLVVLYEVIPPRGTMVILK
jgi:hypothetical protein